MRPRLLFINRSYHPDAEATGQLLTELCEDLAQEFDVAVIAGQPNQNPQQEAYRRYGTELRHGVAIHRVWNTRLPKRWLPARAINLLTFLAGAALRGWFSKRPDVVIVETDPPLLALLGALLQARFRCKLVVYLQDIHPELGIALGRIRSGWMTRWLHRALAWSYRRADRVVVLSEDMRAGLLDHYPDVASIDVIANWCDTRQILVRKAGNAFRRAQAFEGKFVVMYSGNLGLSQGLEDLLPAAAQLQTRDEILFVFVGDGALKQALRRQVEQSGLTNVRFLDYRPKRELSESLGAADVHLVPLAAPACRYLMPSKLYGVLASGTPVISIAPADSELAGVVEGEQVGWNVPPANPQRLAETILTAQQHGAALAAYGQRARELAVRRFDRTVSVAAFREMLQQTLPRRAVSSVVSSAS